MIDGIEFRVKSVLADDFTVRAYVEARDLEGGRLSADMNVYGLFEIPVDMEEDEVVRTSVFRGDCLGYDGESKTALLSVTTWGQPAADDLYGSTVRIWSITDKVTGAELLDGDGGFRAPVEVKPVPSLSMGADSRLASGLQAEEVRLSALGLSVLFRDDNASARFSGKNVSVKLKDGTLIEAPWGGGQRKGRRVGWTRRPFSVSAVAIRPFILYNRLSLSHDISKEASPWETVSNGRS